ncbi:hypothetical protein HYU12_04405 [Candidatus Woesearchaeota archaeon]|nr:hypothetical protein [Candidatus Woesearchaeota archaeon]
MSFFIIVSVIGIMLGVFMITQGVWGNGMGALLTLAIGVFVTVKEIMDIMFAGH